MKALWVESAIPTRSTTTIREAAMDGAITMPAIVWWSATCGICPWERASVSSIKVGLQMLCWEVGSSPVLPVGNRDIRLLCEPQGTIRTLDRWCRCRIGCVKGMARELCSNGSTLVVSQLTHYRQT